MGHKSRCEPGGVGAFPHRLPAVVALGDYESTSRKEAKGRPIAGEHVTDRTILLARLDATEGKLQEARSEAMMAVNQAVKADQGSMLMKARLALGEIELQGANPSAGRRDLEVLVRDADNEGFGLISREARPVLAHASERSHVNQSQSADIGTHRSDLTASATGPRSMVTLRDWLSTSHVPLSFETYSRVDSSRAPNQMVTPQF